MKKLLFVLLFIPSIMLAEVLPKNSRLDIYDNFVGGLDSRDEPHKLKNNQSPYLRNVLIDDGEIKTVNGFIVLGSTGTLSKVNTIFEYIKTDGTRNFLVSDSSVVLATSDFSNYTLIKANLNNNYKLGCIQVEDKSWCSNGNDAVFTFDGSTVVVLDGNTYGSLKTPNVPKFKYLSYWQNRVWGFGIPTNSSYLGYSAIQSTDTVPVAISPDNENAWNNPNFFLDVDKGDGTQPTFMRVYRGQLYVGKERGISAILGNDDISYADVKVVKDYGFLNNDSVVELDNLLVGYGSDDGIYKFDGRNMNIFSDHIRPDVEAFINNVGKNVVLNWDSQSDFTRGSLVGSTATGSGFLTVNFSTYVLVSTPAQGDVTNQYLSMLLNTGTTSTNFVTITTDTANPAKWYQLSSGAIPNSDSYFPYHIVFWVRSDNASSEPSGKVAVTLRNLRTRSTAYYEQTGVSGINPVSSWAEFAVPFAGNSGIKELFFTGDDILNGNFQVRVEVADTCGAGSPNCRFDLRYSSVGSLMFLKDSQIAEYRSDISTAVNISAWGNFNSVFNNQGGNISFAYRVSTSLVNITTYPFMPISPGAVIGSSVSNNYIQWLSTLTFNSTSSLVYIDNVQINYNQGGSNDVNPIGVSWKGRYWLAVTTTASGTTNLIYVKSRNSSDYPDGFTVLEGINIKSLWRSSDYLYAGASTSGIIYRLDYGTNYNGRPIIAIYETNETNFSAPFFEKQLVSYFIDIDKQTNGEITLGTQINNRSYGNYNLNINGSGRLVRHLAYPNSYGNSFRFRFTSSVLDQVMKINNFGVVYINENNTTDNY